MSGQCDICYMISMLCVVSSLTSTCGKSEQPRVAFATRLIAAVEPLSTLFAATLVLHLKVSMHYIHTCSPRLTFRYWAVWTKTIADIIILQGYTILSRGISQSLHAGHPTASASHCVSPSWHQISCMKDPSFKKASAYDYALIGFAPIETQANFSG